MSSPELPNPDDLNAVYNFWLTTTFLVESEEVGVPFLVGQRVRVEGPIRLHPSQPPHYAITPFKIHPKDGRFNGLFKGVKPAIKDYDPNTGAILASGNIVACPWTEDME